jgi:general stress protein 26
MTTKNLQSDKAASKIKELAEGIDFTMLCTDLDAKQFHAIPMSTKRVDEDGAIWFLSGRDSTHNENIQNDSKVQLLYSDPGSMRFLIVYGEATIHDERRILEELYGTSDNAWFKGIDDPNLSAIKVDPLDAHYWDTKNNRLITLAKIGIAAITGGQPDLAEHGDLKL